MKRIRTFVVTAVAAIAALSICRSANARVFVIPHVLESSGKITNTPFTFDSTVFAEYVGLASGDVTVGVFDDLTGKAMTGANGSPICAPCTVNLDASRSEASFNIDDLIEDQGGFDAAVKLGFGIIVVGGNDPDGVNLQGFVVNSHTSPFDVSVFGFEPTPIASSIVGTPDPSTPRVLRFDGFEETPGSTSQFGGCTDTLFKAVYAAGLMDGQTPSSASIQFHLFNADGTPLRAAGGDVPPVTFELNAANRSMSITADSLIEAAGGFTSPLVHCHS